MANRRFRSRSGNGFRKRKRRKSSTMSIAKRALSKVLAIERKIEDKFVLTAQATVAVADTGVITELFPLLQGDDYNQRIGNKVQCRWMEIRTVVSAVGGSSTIRIIIFRNNQQRADVAPAVAAVLHTVSFLSPLNHINRARFTILQDRLVSMTIGATNAVVSQVNFIKLNFEQRFNGVANTDIDKNGIYLLQIASAPVNEPTIQCTAAMHFSDL